MCICMCVCIYTHARTHIIVNNKNSDHSGCNYANAPQCYVTPALYPLREAPHLWTFVSYGYNALFPTLSTALHTRFTSTLTKDTARPAQRLCHLQHYMQSQPHSKLSYHQVAHVCNRFQTNFHTKYNL